MAVRCATTVRPWSSAARSTIANAGAGQRPDQRGGGRAAEHAGEELAEEDEARDAEAQRQQAEQHREHDAPA